jgi:membrane-associated phospholipid phosphatase
VSPREAHFPLPHRSRLFVLVLLLALTSAFPAAGQQPDGRQADLAEDPSAAEEAPPAKPGVVARAWKAAREEARRYGKDSVALLRAPLQWQKNDWEKAGGAVLILGGLMLADRSIDNAAQRERSHFTDRVSGATTDLGGQYGVHASTALLGLGLIFHHENMRDTGREALEAGLFAHILDNYVLKRAFGRERPFESDGRTVFVPFSSHDSFPSGHATEAFAVASVVAARSRGWPIPVLAYTAATIVAMDRVNSRVHFTSDVVAGAFIGTAIGRFLVKRHNDEKAGVLSKADLEVVPIRRGVAARLRF